MKKRRRGNNKSIVVLFVFFCIFLIGSIYSDDFQKVKENIIENSWKRVGFVYIEPSIVLKDIGYNSNIYYFDDVTTPDWTADAGLLVNFSTLIGKRFIFVITESPYYSFYLDNKDLQYFNNELSASVYSYLGRFNLKYVYSTGNVLSRPTIEFGNRIKTERNSHEVSVDYGNYNKFYINVNVGKEDLKYDDSGYSDQYDIGSRMNRETQTVRLTLNKVIFTRTIMFFNSEYYEMKFDSDIQRNGSGGIFSVGIKLPEVSILQGQFQMGIKYFNPEDPDAVEYSKPNGSGAVSIRLTKRFKLRLGYTLENHYSYIDPDQYFDLRSFSTGLDYYVGRNIKAGYNFSSGETVYRKVNGENTGRSDTTEKSDFKLGFRVSGSMELGLRYSRYIGRSSFLEFTRSYNFIGGYINHEF